MIWLRARSRFQDRQDLYSLSWSELLARTGKTRTAPALVRDAGAGAPLAREARTRRSLPPRAVGSDLAGRGTVEGRPRRSVARMWYWVLLTTFAVVMGTLVVFVIVGLLEVLREPILDSTVEKDPASSAPTSPDASARL